MQDDPDSELTSWWRLGPDRLRQRLAPAERSLPVGGAADPAAWARAASTPAGAALLHTAESVVGEPWPVVTLAAQLRYQRDGDRASHEEVVAERHRRLSLAAAAAALTGEDRWVDEVAEGMWAFCEQTSWCWPAHDDVRVRGGGIVPDVEHPFLDLGAGEVGAQLAWVDHVLGPRLDARVPGLRRRVRSEVHERILRPFLDRDDWHWLGRGGDVHNWLPWIAGNVATAGLVLGRDDVRPQVTARALECLGRFVASLPRDGAIDEGFGYWWNGAGRALEALEILGHATGGAPEGWRGDPRLRATVAFPVAMQLGGSWFANFADGSARPATDLAWPSLFRAAETVGDESARTLALQHRDPFRVTSEPRRLGRLVMELLDDAWWAAVPTGPTLPRDTWLPSVQVLVAREHAGTTRGLTLVAKGGHNGEHHNHNDVGNFIVALDGVPVLIDVGRPTYTAQTFGADRYSIWSMQSTWHNVPAIRGSAQSPGRQYTAREVVCEVTERASALELDLACAYDRADLSSWRREMRLDRDAGAVTISDRWLFTAPEETASELVLVVAGTIQRMGPCEVRVRPVEGKRCISITGGRPMRVQARPLDDRLLASVWGPCVNRITIDMRSDISEHSDIRIAVTEERLP